MSNAMLSRPSLFRRAINLAFLGLCWVAAALAVLPLLLVLYHVSSAGLSSVSWSFFTHLPKPVGEVGGGMKQAILGTLEILLIALTVGLPVGIFGGVYLAEYQT